jgi:hypothetical protein
MAPFWAEAGEAGGAVGVGERGRRMEEAGARAGGSLPTGGRRPADIGSRPAGDVRGAHATDRIEGEGRG